MFSLTRFTDARLKAYCDCHQESEALPVGDEFKAGIHAGYLPNRASGVIGQGAEIFSRGRGAIREWRMFPEWVFLWPERPPVVRGQMVVAGARLLGVWAANACRIVKIIDEPRRFGFVYSTIPAHALSGAERFQIEWRENDDVVYDVYSYSRPNGLVAWMTLPFVRSTQQNFAIDSVRNMQNAVAAGTRRDVSQAAALPP